MDTRAQSRHRVENTSVRVYAPAATLLALVSLTGHAEAQNLPPIAVAEADALEPLVGQLIRFSAAGSLDPDEGPSALTFEWDFDDGERATGPEITHAFDDARAYRVRVRVSDSEASTEAGLTLYVLAPTAERPPRHSRAITLDATHVYVTDPIAGRVVALARASFDVSWSTTIDEPRDSTLSPDGSELWVACADGALRALSVSDGEVTRELPLGRRLHGVVSVPSRGGVLVTAPDEALVISLGPDLEALEELDVAGDPRAIAIAGDGETAYVASFLTRAPATAGVVTELDLRSGTTAPIELALDVSPDSASSGGGVPNLLGAVALSPSGATLWVGGTKSNSGRGLFVDGRELTPENRVRGLLAPISLPDRVDRGEARIDTNDAGQVSALAFSPRGRFVYAAHPGVGAVSIYDLAAAALFEGREPGSTVPFEARLDVGPTPDALVLDGAQLYVRLREARVVVAVDVSDPSAPRVVGRVSLGDDPRPSAVSLGALLFHSSRAPTFSRGGYIACATCHPGGSLDGRTWDFTQSGEGLRNTIDLRGRAGLAHGPLHWSANFDEVQDFENDIVFGFGGEGLAGDGEGPHPSLGPRPNAGRSAELDALSAYVESLDAVPQSPHRAADGELTADAERGRQIFFDADVGCATCHAPPRFTDSSFAFELHDVGTIRGSSGGRLGGPLEGLDTPSLLGVWATAPYLHDGRAPDLRAVLVTENPDDRHGRTGHLTPAQLDDLIAYLRQLDDREASRPAPSAGCACALVADGRPGPGGSLPLLLVSLLLAAARARSKDASGGVASS